MSEKKGSFWVKRKEDFEWKERKLKVKVRRRKLHYPQPFKLIIKVKRKKVFEWKERKLK